MVRRMVGCAVTLGVVLAFLGGCQEGDDGISALPADQITAEEQAVVADSLVALQAMDVVADVAVAESTKGARAAKGSKETTTQTIDATVDVSTVDPNASGTVYVNGSITVTETQTSISGGGSVTVTTGVDGVTYTDPVTGDSATVTIPSPGVQVSVSVSGSGSDTSASMTVAVTGSYSGVEVTANVGGTTIQATAAESCTVTVSLTMSVSGQTLFMTASASVVGFRQVDYSVDGDDHSVRLDLNVSMTASGLLGEEPSVALVNKSVIVTVDGVAYAYDLEKFIADYGYDPGVDDELLGSGM